MRLLKGIAVLGTIAALIVGCEAGDRNKLEDASAKVEEPTNDSISTDRAYIKPADDADYKADFDSAISRDDFRFVGVMEYSLVVPGVPDYQEQYSRSNGVKVIEGTSDSYQNTTEMKKHLSYEEYAKAYNQLLLAYLSRDKE